MRQQQGWDLTTSPPVPTPVNLPEDDRYIAVRVVAGGHRDMPGTGARDADDLRELLDALGLFAAEGQRKR